MAVGLLFVGRLFYLQIIKHDAYKSAALAEQFKKFSIPAERGTISLSDGDKSIPVVLNETRYLLYADPGFIISAKEVAEKLQPVIGGSVEELEKKLSTPSRYVELAKKLDEPTKQKIDALELKGVVTKEQRARTYPQGQLAAQALGFVNADGEGQYGVEGYLDRELAGEPGQLKAITDVRGVPLAGNADNVVKEPVPGKNVTLTLDTTIQRIAEESIKNGVTGTNAQSGSIVIFDVNSGAVKGMANWPSFEPAAYESVTDQTVFKNKTVTDPLEVGSIMKTLTISAGLDQGVIGRDSTYYDAGYEEVDGFRITNAINFGTGDFTVFDIIRNSLNTGAVHVLKAMGGGEVNEKARTVWYDYMFNRYQLGKNTGIEQSGEASGVIPDPIEGDGRNIQYANTAFGQGMTATPLQMAAAVGSIVNGGTYYKPHIVARYDDPDGTSVEVKPEIVRSGVISAAASADIVNLMERYAQANNREAARPGFAVGGKTGTAQIADGNGGYKEGIYNGTYAGFVGGKNPEYVIVIALIEPRIKGFAGSDGARPIFTATANAMLDSLPFQPNQ